MEDLKITVESNSGEKFENCQTVVVTEDDRCRKFLESWKVKLCSCPDSLILDEYHDGESDNICLVRFGGSTVSFNVISYCSITKSFKEVSCSSDNTLGTSKIIRVVADFLGESFCRKYRVPRDELSKRSKRKLELQAKQVLQALSSTNQAAVHVDSLHDGIDFQFSLSRGRFEDMIIQQVNQIVNLIPSETCQLIVYGGGANIPLFKRQATAKHSKITYLNEETVSILASKSEAKNLEKVKVKTTLTDIFYGDTIILPKRSPVPSLATGDLEISNDKNYICCTEGQLSEALKDLNPDEKISYIIAYEEKGCRIMLNQGNQMKYDLVF